MDTTNKPGGIINLAKRGDAHTIDLTKKSGEILVNLNWETTSGKKLFGLFGKDSIDLDLGCLYRLKDGRKGIIQALGETFGSAKTYPYIVLDKDDRTGASTDGENLRFIKPEVIDFVVVFAFIYEGASNWSAAKGIVTVKQQAEPDIVIKLDNPDDSKFMCGLVTIENQNNKLVITKHEKYYAGHEALDRAFDFGFEWVEASKD